MSKVLSWFHTEPVRTVLYPALLVLLGIAVARGFLTEDYKEAVVEVLSVLVLGTPATEFARAQVTPIK